MTVKDLIEHLKKMPQDSEVYYFDGSSDAHYHIWGDPEVAHQISEGHFIHSREKEELDEWVEDYGHASLEEAVKADAIKRVVLL